MPEQEAFLLATQTMTEIIDQVKDEQWDKPTPDTQWTVRDLVAHIVEGVLWVPDLLAGKTIAEVGNKYSGNVLGDDPKTVWHEAARSAEAAVRKFEEPDQPVHLSYGDYPARTYLQHQTIDLTIHAWDLARSIGAKEELPGELVEAVWQWFEPQAQQWRDAGILAQPVPVPDDTPVQVRILALSGREV
jgi:uncharacterized protein (TIGR03086 family)